MSVFTPEPQSITALWLVLISRSAEGRRLSWRRAAGDVCRKCETGEGLFMFDSKNNEADIIFERVQKATRSLARARQGDVSDQV